VDSQRHLLEANIESLRVLKEMAQERLIIEIPLVVTLNKQDLKDVIGVDEFKQVLKDEKLWYEPNHKFYSQNPLIFKTYVLPKKTQNIYRSFFECARQTIKDVDLKFPSVSRWGRKKRLRVKFGNFKHKPYRKNRSLWGYGGNSHGPIVPEHQINHNLFEIENDDGPPYKSIKKDQKKGN
jgi:hypothetical protein